MNSVKVSNYIKLGTSLRYLIDADGGEPLGDKYILQNIETVFNLIKELEFDSTYNSAGIKKLNVLYEQLKAYSTSNTQINKKQAKELEQACRKIRESLLTEGDGIEVVRKTKEQGLEPEPKVTLRWLIDHVPAKWWLTIFGALISILITVYSFGVLSSKSQFVREIFQLEQTLENTNEKPIIIQTNDQLKQDPSH